MKKLYAILPSVALSMAALHAQAPQYDYLQANKIKARINGNGLQFHSNGSGYTINGGDTVPGLNGVSLWACGENSTDGSIHTAHETGTFANLAPGPLRLDLQANTPLFTDDWNRVFKVSRAEIEDFRQAFALGNVQNGTFPVPAALAAWPGNGPLGYATQLAPYIDVNGDQQYDPLQGDYPKIKGDEAIWLVMNDKSIASAHPLDIEVQIMAYALEDLNAAGDDSLINYTTFLEYRIINRSQKDYVNFRSAININFWRGMDGGAYWHNGTCVYNNAFYAYYPYGPATLRNKLTQSIMLVSGGKMAHTKVIHGNMADYPYSNTGIHNLLNDKWFSGTNMYYGNMGRQDSANCGALLTQTAKFFMPAGSDTGHTGTGVIDPGFNWQFNKTGCPSIPSVSFITPSEALVVAAADSLFTAGSTCTFEFAFISQFNDVPADSADIEDLLHTVCLKMDPVKDYYNNVIVPAYETFSTQVFSKPALFKIYPNPSCTEIFLETDIEKPFGVQILNISGQTVRSISGYSNKTAIDISALAPGFYILKAADGSSNHSITFIKTRE